MFLFTLKMLIYYFYNFKIVSSLKSLDNLDIFNKVVSEQTSEVSSNQSSKNKVIEKKKRVF